MRSPTSLLAGCAPPAPTPNSHLELGRPPSFSRPWNMSPASQSPCLPRLGSRPALQPWPACLRQLNSADANHAVIAYHSTELRPKDPRLGKARAALAVDWWKQ